MASQTFVSAMNAPPHIKQGVKDSDVYTEEGVGDNRVTLFQMLVRGLSPDYILDTITKSNPNHLRDFAVMAFQTRDIRGGKGERTIFYSMLLSLILQVPNLTEPLVRLVPEYGCWQDLWHLYYPEKIFHAFASTSTIIQTAILNLVKWVFFEDLQKLSVNQKPSLLGKWLPREGSKNDHLAQIFATSFYPEIALQDDRLRAYRKACSALNMALNTTEVLMCNTDKEKSTWSTIKPAHVPGRLLKKAKAAFMNELVNTRKGRRFNPRFLEAVENTRFPNNLDRIKCQKNFQEHMNKVLEGKASVKGGDTVFPHELVREVMSVTKNQENIIEAQWIQIRNTLMKSFAARIVPMSDFSGSMEGIPLQVSMALGILLSELNSPAFKDYLLAFDSFPSWISFKGLGTLKEKVGHARKFAQGLSTDFQKACDLILERLVTHKVPLGEAPTDLVVFTDMGFDAACGKTFNNKTKPWQTHVQMIRANFEKFGYVAPRIVLWNLRAEYKDFHAKAGEDGVLILSGWSPALMKIVLSNNISVRTPYEGLREVLDNGRYDRVRVAFDETV